MEQEKGDIQNKLTINNPKRNDSNKQRTTPGKTKTNQELKKGKQPTTTGAQLTMRT